MKTSICAVGILINETIRFSETPKTVECSPSQGLLPSAAGNSKLGEALGL